MDGIGNTTKSAFDPEMVATINRAYESALSALGVEHSHSDRRAALAKHIMDVAQSGETDEARLREAAVARMKGAESGSITYTGL